MMKKQLVTFFVPLLVSLAGAGITVSAHAQEAPKSREAVKAEAKAARKAGTIVEGDKAGIPGSGASGAMGKGKTPAAKP